MSDRRKALGCSLEDLGISDLLLGSAESSEGNYGVHARYLPVDIIKPNPYQPRKHFSAKGLEELSLSIKEQGLLQPIVVRSLPDDTYELIAGERRLRASQLAGMKEIPALIKEISEKACLVLAVVENLQRHDLNVVDLAESLCLLSQKYSMTHAEVGQLIGKSRASVSNVIRLLQLNKEVKHMLVEGLLEMGHARCLLSLSQERQAEVALKIVENGMPVRDVEALVRRETAEGSGNAVARRGNKVSFVQKSFCQNMKGLLGVDVAIKPKKNGGTVVFNYKNEEQLQNWLGVFLKNKEPEVLEES